MPNEMTPLEAASRIEEHMRVHKLGEPRAIHISEALKLAVAVLRQIVAGELRPVIHGKWLYSRTVSELAVSKCSVCGKEQFSISNVVAEGKYCPSCGALMDGKDDSNAEVH